MKNNRDETLGIRLNKAEKRALILMAKSKGLNKSTYARTLLVEQLTAQGALVYNPAPVVDEITAQARHG